MHVVLPPLRPLQTSLLEDAAEGPGRQIISRVTRNCDAASLPWMLELAMTTAVTTFDGHDVRALFLDQLDDIAYLPGWAQPPPNLISAHVRVNLVRPPFTARRDSMPCEGMVKHPVPNRALLKACRQSTTRSRVQ